MGSFSRIIRVLPSPESSKLEAFVLSADTEHTEVIIPRKAYCLQTGQPHQLLQFSIFPWSVYNNYQRRKHTSQGNYICNEELIREGTVLSPRKTTLPQFLNKARGYFVIHFMKQDMKMNEI